ncbi:hypothetical protein BpHYR1_018431 [Brachionus plicatilis]|uniref:Uncharacterized protein n=1 Tax=Brachionus plicatilis TaxID=10195 RepID=A0A3M7PK66_BRAPC|nr:hypothetical protein BpHYR1_018431 [Brachionus plicatilis]
MENNAREKIVFFLVLNLFGLLGLNTDGSGQTEAILSTIFDSLLRNKIGCCKIKRFSAGLRYKW